MTARDRSAAAPTGGVIPPGQGRALPGASTRPIVKIGPHMGSRKIGILESELPPGAQFPGHVHESYDEAFYVLEGEIEYLIDDAWVTAERGSTVFVPAGRVHAFRNAGEAPCRHLAIASPAEAMTMIEELSRAGLDELAGILARYHSRLAGPDAGQPQQ